jgi:hypothetical protein
MGNKIKIAKRHIDLPEPYFVRAMAEIKGQTSRGAAIAGTAFLDLLLRTAIESRIRPQPEIQDILFENRGALQDFSNRIQIAFAFKIIGTGAYIDLCILRDIRNAFAHSAEAFDFDRKDISDKCNSLWYPCNTNFANMTMPTTPRDKFIRAVELLAVGIIENTPVPNATRPPSMFIQQGPPWPPPATSPKKPKIRPSRGRPTQNKKTEK